MANKNDDKRIGRVEAGEDRRAKRLDQIRDYKLEAAKLDKQAAAEKAKKLAEAQAAELAAAEQAKKGWGSR